MKSLVFSGLLALVVVFSCEMSSTASSCECAKPPGGGVTCEEDQIAICNPKNGTCDCTCKRVKQGQSREQYLSEILSTVVGKTVTSAEINTQYKDSTASFVKSEMDYTAKYSEECAISSCEYSKFLFPLESLFGEKKYATVVVPRWLAKVLRQKPLSF